MIRHLTLAVLLAGVTLPAAAQEAAVKARQGLMQLYALNLGVLGGMAQGRTAYDDAAAQEAADNLYHLTRYSMLGAWPEGTGAGFAGSRAQPGVWENNADFLARYAALQAGAEAMQAAAGTDLAALQGAMGGLAGACQACHQLFRSQ